MRSDSDLRRDVEEALQWEPHIDHTNIAVAVKGGVVTLRGCTRSYGDKFEAETGAKRVRGVLGVTNDIEVRLPDIDRPRDSDVARDASARLKQELPVTSERVKVIVKDGAVTLEGEVGWNFQRDRAERAVRRLKGVTSVSNLIKLKPPARSAGIKAVNRVSVSV